MERAGQGATEQRVSTNGKEQRLQGKEVCQLAKERGKKMREEEKRVEGGRGGGRLPEGLRTLFTAASYGVSEMHSEPGHRFSWPGGRHDRRTCHEKIPVWRRSASVDCLPVGVSMCVV